MAAKHWRTVFLRASKLVFISWRSSLCSCLKSSTNKCKSSFWARRSSMESGGSGSAGVSKGEVDVPIDGCMGGSTNTEEKGKDGIWVCIVRGIATRL